MAITYTNSGTGGIPNGTVVATRDVGGAVGHAQRVDVGPWAATAKTPGQYALSVTTAAAVALTPASGATHALVSVDTGGGNIRWTRDGSTPTSSAGHLLQAGDMVEIDNVGAFKAIAVGATTTLQVSYHTYA